MEPSSVYYKKSSIKPLPPEGGRGGLIYFKHIWGRRLIKTGLIWEGGIFILAKIIISVPHKKLEAQSTSTMAGDHAAEDQNLIQHVNKPSWISPFEVLLLWLRNTVYHLLVKNDRRRGGGGLKKEKEGGGGYLRGRLNREFMVLSVSKLHV